MNELSVNFKVFRIKNGGLTDTGDDVCVWYGSEKEAVEDIARYGLENEEYIVLPTYYVRGSL